MHLSLAKIPVLLIITANYFQSYFNSVNTLEPPLFTSLINYLFNSKPLNSLAEVGNLSI